MVNRGFPQRTHSFIDTHKDEQTPSSSPPSLRLLYILFLLTPGRSGFTEPHISNYAAALSNGGDTSIDTGVIQSYRGDMMQCWPSIISPVSQ